MNSQLQIGPDKIGYFYEENTALEHRFGLHLVFQRTVVWSHWGLHAKNVSSDIFFMGIIRFNTSNMSNFGLNMIDFWMCSKSIGLSNPKCKKCWVGHTGGSLRCTCCVFSLPNKFFFFFSTCIGAILIPFMCFSCF